MDVIATVRDDRTRSATRLALSQLHSSLQSLHGEAERSLVRRQLTALSAAVDKRSIHVAGCVEGTQRMANTYNNIKDFFQH